jgi:hypothetical protein
MLMFPDGYVANLSRGVNLSTMRVLGMKSHDFHIWIEQILPVMVRGYVPDSGVDQGTPLHRNMTLFLERVREMGCPISFPGSNVRYMLSL